MRTPGSIPTLVAFSKVKIDQDDIQQGSKSAASTRLNARDGLTSFSASFFPLLLLLFFAFLGVTI